jgi:uncharacterized membrane protein
MATLSAWKFGTPEGAERTEQILLGLQKQGLIQVIDAAIVTWPANKKKPKTKQLTSLAGVGAVTGAFWGLLFGLLFFIPFIGMAIGAGMGALAASLADVGLSDDFIKSVRAEVTPGTSALFLLSDAAVQDRVVSALAEMHPQLITTNLSQEDEARLRAAFAEE